MLIAVHPLLYGDIENKISNHQKRIYDIERITLLGTPYISGWDIGGCVKSNKGLFKNGYTKSINNQSTYWVYPINIRTPEFTISYWHYINSTDELVFKHVQYTSTHIIKYENLVEVSKTSRTATYGDSHFRIEFGVNDVINDLRVFDRIETVHVMEDTYYAKTMALDFNDNMIEPKRNLAPENYIFSMQKNEIKVLEVPSDKKYPGMRKFRLTGTATSGNTILFSFGAQQFIQNEYYTFSFRLFIPKRTKEKFHTDPKTWTLGFGTDVQNKSIVNKNKYDEGLFCATIVPAVNTSNHIEIKGSHTKVNIPFDNDDYIYISEMTIVRKDHYIPTYFSTVNSNLSYNPTLINNAYYKHFDDLNVTYDNTFPEVLQIDDGHTVKEGVLNFKKHLNQKVHLKDIEKTIASDQFTLHCQFRYLDRYSAEIIRMYGPDNNISKGPLILVNDSANEMQIYPLGTAGVSVGNYNVIQNIWYDIYITYRRIKGTNTTESIVYINGQKMSTFTHNVTIETNKLSQCVLGFSSSRAGNIQIKDIDWYLNILPQDYIKELYTKKFCITNDYSLECSEFVENTATYYNRELHQEDLIPNGYNISPQRFNKDLKLIRDIIDYDPLYDKQLGNYHINRNFNNTIVTGTLFESDSIYLYPRCIYRIGYKARRTTGQAAGSITMTITGNDIRDTPVILTTNITAVGDIHGDIFKNEIFNEISIDRELFTLLPNSWTFKIKLSTTNNTEFQFGELDCYNLSFNQLCVNRSKVSSDDIYIKDGLISYVDARIPTTGTDGKQWLSNLVDSTPAALAETNGITKGSNYYEIDGRVNGMLLNTPTFSKNESWTISFRMMLKSPGPGVGVQPWFGTNGDRRIYLGSNSTMSSIHITPVTAIFTLPEPNIYHTIDVLYDHTSKSAKIYVDGIIKNTLSGINDVELTPNNKLGICRFTNSDNILGSSHQAHGHFQCFRMYNRVLKPDEVQHNYLTDEKIFAEEEHSQSLIQMHKNGLLENAEIQEYFTEGMNAIILRNVDVNNLIPTTHKNIINVHSDGKVDLQLDVVIKYFRGEPFIRLFRHDNKGGTVLWSNKNETLLNNIEHPLSQKYSLMHFFGLFNYYPDTKVIIDYPNETVAGYQGKHILYNNPHTKWTSPTNIKEDNFDVPSFVKLKPSVSANYMWTISAAGDYGGLGALVATNGGIKGPNDTLPSVKAVTEIWVSIRDYIVDYNGLTHIPITMCQFGVGYRVQCSNIVEV